MGSDAFYPYAHGVWIDGTFVGITKAGVTVKFITERRFNQPPEYQAPKKSYIASKLPVSTTVILEYSATTAKAIFGKMASGSGGSNSGGRGQEETDNAVQLQIKPIGSKGITLTVYKALPDDASQSILTQQASEQKITWLTMNNGEHNAADWDESVAGTSGEATTRQAEIEKIESYFKANFTESTWVVPTPPKDWNPGLMSPSIYICPGATGNPFDDPRIFYIDLDIWLYNVNYSDPFGQGALSDNNSLHTEIMQAIGFDAYTVITSLSMNGRVIGSRKPIYDKKKQMAFSVIKFRLYVNED